MKRLFLLAALLLGLLMPVGVVGVSNAAYDPIGAACSTPEAKQSDTCKSKSTTDPITGKNGILRKVSVILALISGIVAVIIIIVAGIQYVLSGGDTQKVASAKNMIISALVGLVVIVSAESILLFVLNKLAT